MVCFIIRIIDMSCCYENMNDSESYRISFSQLTETILARLLEMSSRSSAKIGASDYSVSLVIIVVEAVTGMKSDAGNDSDDGCSCDGNDSGGVGAH